MKKYKFIKLYVIGQAFLIAILSGGIFSCSMPGAWDMLAALESPAGDIDPEPEPDPDPDPEPDPEPVITDWNYRVKLSVNNSGSLLTDFPLAIHMDSMGIDLSLIEDDQDLTFKSLDNSEDYSYELEEVWDPSGSPVVWVKIPEVAAAATTDIWMYYSSDSESGIHNPNAVWSNDYQGIWHLNDSSAPFTDSTSEGNNASKPPSWVASSVIGTPLFSGKSISMPGANSGLSTNDWGTGSESNEVSLSFWFVQDEITASRTIMEKGNFSINVIDGNNTIDVVGNPNGNLPVYSRFVSAEWYKTVPSWITITWDGSQDQTGIRLYCNGELANSYEGSDNVGIPDGNFGDGPLYIGNNSGGGSGIKARFDDIHLSDVVRSADWISATWKAYDDSLITFGAQESAPF